MTRVEIENARGHWNIRICGHAGYADSLWLGEGHDIVCAAVSCLSQALVQTLELFSEAGAIENYQVRMEAGLIEAAMTPVPEAAELMEYTMIPVKIGFEMLSSTFSDYVQTGWGSSEEICDMVLKTIKKALGKDPDRTCGKDRNDAGERP